MADIVIDFLRSLERVKGDPLAQSALTAEFALSALPEPEREPIRAALDAAAVLHWFEPSLLQAMLEIPPEQARTRYEILKTFSFVESYRSQDQGLLNIHESTRLGWRRKIAHGNPERFRALSARAAAIFAHGEDTIRQIEWIYHLLCADPEAGADELQELDRKWTSTAHPEQRYALAATLSDLEQSKLVDGAARVEVLLYVAEARNSRGETSRLEESAREVLALSKSIKRLSAEARANCLLGDVLQAQGKLDAAREAFDH